MSKRADAGVRVLFTHTHTHTMTPSDRQTISRLYMSAIPILQHANKNVQCKKECNVHAQLA